MSELRTTKHKKVLEHLQTHGSITSMDAINLYGATRLSAIIFCLKKAGYDIKTERHKSKDRYNNTVSFATYILINNTQEEN